MNIPVMIQMQPGENGAAALCMLLGYYKKYVSLQEMRESCPSSRNGVSPGQLLCAAEHFGLVGEVRELDAGKLRDQKLPLIIFWKSKYYAIIESVKGNLVKVADPAKGEYSMEFDKLQSLYMGKVIVLRPGPDFKPGGKRKELSELLGEKIRQLRTALIVLLIFSVVCLLLDFAQTILTKRFMDDIVGRGSYTPEREKIFLAALYGITTLILLFSLLRKKLVNQAGRNAAARSGSILFKKMLALPMRFFEQYSVGDLMFRLESNKRLHNTIVQVLVPRLIDAAMTVFYFILLLRYNRILALACIAIELLNLLATIYAQRKNAIAARSAITSRGVLTTSVLNGMNMIDTIKSGGAERSFYNLWHNYQLQLIETTLTGQRIRSYSTFASSILNHLVQAVHLFLGAYFAAHGHLTLGTMALFQSVLSKMRGSFGSFLSTVHSLQTMRTSIERVNDIMNRETGEEISLPEEAYSSADKLRGVLTASHVRFRYNSGDDLVVNDVSLSVGEGQVVAIVGATGCGKSTLLKLLADLYEPESGEILYSGKRRSEIPDVIFSSSVSTVDQESMVFEDTIAANIRMWDSTIEDYEVIMAARDAQIHERIMKESDGYSAVFLENGRNFSGGELQRLELARALSREPTLLLLDEFTSALDALTEDRVIHAIRQKGVTCVIVAHRLSTVVDCDRIYVMDKGRIVEEGTHDELCKMNGLYKKLIASA